VLDRIGSILGNTVSPGYICGKKVGIGTNTGMSIS
jgi:hypothetical protein